jgi:hypothetical protein
MRYTDTQLVQAVSTGLAEFQEILIAKVQSGRTENQSIVPTVSLTFTEIRKMTHRTRIRNALIDKLVGWLEDEGLEVEQEDDQLVITKPAEYLDVEFGSLRLLQNAVRSVNNVAQLKLA